MKYVIIPILIICLILSCSSESTKKNIASDDTIKKEGIEKSQHMMDEDVFWSIIESSRGEGSDLEANASRLTQKLAKMSTAEIIGFHLRQQKLLHASYISDLWCAAYIMNGGCSDDCFEYFRCWLISQGREAYDLSLKNPDYLVNLYSLENEVYDFEDLMYVATIAFEQKTKQDIEDFAGYNECPECIEPYPEFKFTWEEDNEESMRKICPKLMEIAWD